MPDYRNAGMGWPNGPVDQSVILSLPSDRLLMLVTEARYHHDEAVHAGKTVVWRAIPRHGKRPAELSWSPGKFVDEALNLTTEASEHIQEFIPANELDLQDERGDHEDDLSNLDARYSLIGGFLYSAFTMLRYRLPGTRLHFPAFTPDHDALLSIDRWRPAAELYDVVDFHAYDTLDKIQQQYALYRSAFPSMPLALTEWHGKGDAEEEARILTWLADAMAVDPLFDAAYRFIWQWFDHPGWWSDAYDVVHNPPMLALFQHPPAVAPILPPEPEPEPAPMTIYEQFIREAAAARGIDPDVAVTVAKSEGGVDQPAAHGDFETGDSWWPFQLHYGGPGYEQYGTTAGMGNGFTSLTGWQPGDPDAWRDSVRYALNRAKAGGWGPWYGAAHVGVGQWDGIDRSAPWDGNSETWDYETGGMPVPDPTPRVVFDPTFPPTIQDDNWSCAPSSLDWALRALGRTPGHSYIENLLVRDGVVTIADGLLDATGGQLAAWIGKKVPADVYYGSDGFYGNNEASITFDAVAAEIGPYPLLIGGRAWGHWSGVRGVSNGMLLLANPAPGWLGIDQTMSAQEFAALGPFSMVRVLHPDLLEPPPVPQPEPQPSRADVLKAEIDERVAELAALAQP